MSIAVAKSIKTNLPNEYLVLAIKDNRFILITKEEHEDSTSITNSVVLNSIASYEGLLKINKLEFKLRQEVLIDIEVTMHKNTCTITANTNEGKIVLDVKLKQTNKYVDKLTTIPVVVE